jgi:hypothetical protein
MALEAQNTHAQPIGQDDFHSLVRPTLLEPDPVRGGRGGTATHDGEVSLSTAPDSMNGWPRAVTR